MGVNEWVDPRGTEAIAVGHLTRADLAELREAFNAADKDCTGACGGCHDPRSALARSRVRGAWARLRRAIAMPRRRAAGEQRAAAGRRGPARPARRVHAMRAL
jgi:hypothetical protein